jgi:hypothetical protein
MIFFLDLLSLMKGWKEKNVSQVIVYFLTAFDVSLNEL